MKNQETTKLVPNWWDQGICLITGFYTRPNLKALNEQKAKVKSKRVKISTDWN